MTAPPSPRPPHPLRERLGRGLGGAVVGLAAAYFIQPIGHGFPVGALLGFILGFLGIGRTPMGGPVLPIAPTTATKGRLEFLDAARAVAAVMVMGDHILERFFPTIYAPLNTHVYWGFCGVALFFLISGMIIPATIERPGATLGTFWTSRIFRIYPLFLVSLLLAVAIQFGLGIFAAPTLSTDPANTLAANVLFLQEFARNEAQQRVFDPVIPLYWTLSLEMFFYLLTSALFVAGWQRRTVPILIGIIAIMAFQLWRFKTQGLPVAFGYIAWTSLFFLGTAFNRWRAGSLKGPVLAVLVLAVTGLYAFGSGMLRGTFFEPMVVAAVGLFLATCLVPFRVPRWLEYLGLVSYGIYLIHGLLLLTVDPHPTLSPVLQAYGVALIPATLGLAALSHRFLEGPAIEFGRKIARGFAAPPLSHGDRPT